MRKVSKAIPVAAACLSILIGMAVLGQEPTSEAPEFSASPADELSRSRYSARQKATLEMWRQRDVSREQVQEAARHSDPEVAGRAKWVLRQWRRGSVPGMPPKILRLLQSDDPAAIEELLEYGQFGAAVVALEESAGSVNLESIQERISNAMVRRFPVYVALAFKQNSLPDLLRLVDLSARTKGMAVCRMQLMQHLGLPVDDSTLLPTAAETWTESERLQAKVLLLYLLGRNAEAAKWAEQSAEEELQTLTLMMSGRWHEMAVASVKLAESAEDGSREQTHHWSHALVAADRSGNAQIAARAIEALTSNQTADKALNRDLMWQSLAMHGLVDEALALLSEKSPQVAAEIALTSYRTEQAFTILGLSPNEVDLKLDQWIDDAITAETERIKQADALVSDSAAGLLMFMRGLIVIGRDDAAWRIASRLASTNDEFVGSELRDQVLYQLLMSARSEWVIDLAVQKDERSISTTVEHYLTFALPDLDRPTFKILMDAMAFLLPGLDFRDRFHVVCDLISGEVPKAFDEPGMFERLFDRLTNGKRQIQGLVGRVIVNPRPQLNENIVALFARHGKSDLAKRCLQVMAQQDDAYAVMELAESELSRGRTEKASEYLNQVWRQVQGTGSANRNLNADANYAAKALVGQWIISKREGDVEQSERLLQQLKITLYSPSTEMRHEMAGYLSERGYHEIAREIYDLLLPMTAFGSKEATEFYDVAREFALHAREQNPHEAARWFDLAVVGIMESRFRDRAFITLPLYVRRIALEGAIKDRNQSNIREHFARMAKLSPLDIDIAERLLPDMREAGMTKLADEMFDQIFDDGLAHVEQFSFDATVANNLAWVAAMNGRRIDEALLLSERACYLEPDSAVYRDTLAEVLFLLDRVEEALHVEAACVLDDPDQWHLHQQIEKYREVIAEP